MCSYKKAGTLNGKTLTFDTEVTDAIVEYELAEEIIEPYSLEQKEAYTKLMQATAYDDTTNIICTDEIPCSFRVNAKISKIKKIMEGEKQI